MKKQMANQESYYCIQEMLCVNLGSSTGNSLVSKAEEPVSVAWGNFDLSLPVDRFSGHTQIPVRLPSDIHLFKIKYKRHSCCRRLTVLLLLTSTASHLPVVSPRWDHLSSQHADDPVKPLLVVWKQLLSISTPNLHKRISLMHKYSYNVHTQTHRAPLTLFMSSEMISLGWAVLASSVTSTVERTQKRRVFWYFLMSRSVEDTVVRCLTCILLQPLHPCRRLWQKCQGVSIKQLRENWNGHSLGSGCAGLISLAVWQPAGTNQLVSVLLEVR